MRIAKKNNPFMTVNVYEVRITYTTKQKKRKQAQRDDLQM